ncbi:extracellular solute-binding protein [Desulfopila aestuarii]|uniref:Iron(III) transport system substrate-binding protein n=1 Tax=Desulfopila aestuarii DSM 18488 TaxID=1121416 RepID=A0A1M7YHZ6_9BACT|nr:extracellular solute-binding protein [Desulfopila aestuarii]SHO52233.1 iron(III) transport system substrate-binding protein [Desulfopila aestuarii DSM 18488]
MFSRLFAVMMLLGICLPMNASAGDDEVIVYSARNEHLIQPIFEAYTKKTGVKVKYVTGDAGALLERLKSEGTNTSADMFITVDAGNLWQAAQAGVLQPITSEVLESNVPANLQDPENMWFGLSVRARTIVYNTTSDAAEKLSTYEDLANENWKKRLILRTSKKVYNQSLVASLIAEHGPEKAEQLVTGWVANLAADPFSNDTKALEAVAAGIGDVTIVNTYYFGRLMKEKPELPLAIFWPNQNSNGVHMNVSGAGITSHAKNKEAAIKLLEWLSSEEAQGQFAGLNMEYPVNRAVSLDPVVAKWGTFTGNPMNVAKYGELQGEAIMLMDRVGYK